MEIDRFRYLVRDGRELQRIDTVMELARGAPALLKNIETLEGRLATSQASIKFLSDTVLRVESELRELKTKNAGSIEWLEPKPSTKTLLEDCRWMRNAIGRIKAIVNALDDAPAAERARCGWGDSCAAEGKCKRCDLLWTNYTRPFGCPERR